MPTILLLGVTLDNTVYKYETFWYQKKKEIFVLKKHYQNPLSCLNNTKEFPRQTLKL